MASGALPCVVPATTTFCPNHQVSFPAGLSTSVLAPLIHFHAVANRTFAVDLWSLFSPFKTENDSIVTMRSSVSYPVFLKQQHLKLCWEVQSLSGDGKEKGGERDKEQRQQKDATLPGWPLLCDKDVCLADTAAGPCDTFLPCVHKEGEMRA